MEIYQDLTDDDISNLPLPNGWIHTISMNNRIAMYKEVHTGIESFEHPLIVQTLNDLKYRKLPIGWVVKEIVLEDDTKDLFYFNAELGISKWDHPLFRKCLADCLFKNNFQVNAINILSNRNTAIKDYTNASNYEEKFSYHNLVDDNEYNDGEYEDCDEFNDKVEYNDNIVIEEEKETVERRHLHFEDLANSDVDNDEHAPKDDEILSFPSKERDWESLLIAHQDHGNELTEKISHRIQEHTRPPMSDMGIACLRDDTIEANERIHQLLIKLRTCLCKNSNINFSITYHDDDNTMGDKDFKTYSKFSPPNGPMQNNELEKSQVTLASDIVAAIRQNPEYIIHAMHVLNKKTTSHNTQKNNALFQIAFTTIHRLLHPFSADNSMTTAILLSAINSQLDELVSVQQIFSNHDSKLIISRALFIHDPETAVSWDPFMTPMPVLLPAQSEESDTVLTCLLRMYSIRRDVSTYFKIIWKPALPGVVSLLDLYATNNQNQSYLIKNTILLAYRILEYTFQRKSIVAFPSSASAVCRAIYEVGDYSTIHSYLLQLLILPNLLKVLAGDHDSLENEDVYREENIDQLIHKYFDSSFWYHYKPQNIDLKVLDPIRCLIWITWKLYVSAIFMTDEQITILTLNSFFDESFPLYESLNQHELDHYFPMSRLKNMIRRIREKIEKGCSELLVLTLDQQGISYLEINPGDTTSNRINDQNNPNPYISHPRRKGGETGLELDTSQKDRENMLNFKPNEILNLTVVSKYEIEFIFKSIYETFKRDKHYDIDIDIKGQSLYLGIEEYFDILSIDKNKYTSDDHENILGLTFLYMNDSDDFTENNTLSFRSQQLLTNRYHQLLRGLKLCNRYEDTLIRMISRVKDGKISNIFEFTTTPITTTALIESSENENKLYEKHLFDSPEFDVSFKSDHIPIADKHTVCSKTRQKKNNHGLSKPVDIPIFPLFSQYNKVDHHPNIASLKELQTDIINSYRFGSKASAVGVGTSFAREKVFSPVVKPGAVNVTARKQSSSVGSRGRSKYTKIEINPNANVLKPTESYINCKLPINETETYYQKDKHFMKQVRTYDVIPTQEFLSRYQKRQQQQQQRSHYPATNTTNHNTASYHSHNVQPFPEHLRNRIRQHGFTNIDDNGSIGGTSHSRTYSTAGRSRSPSLPIPIPHKTEFQAPTLSILNKHATIDDSKNNFRHTKFQRDIHAGHIPLSRAYDATSSPNHTSAFSPTANRIHSSTGARKPRVPAFLDPRMNDFEAFSPDRADYYNSGGESSNDSRSVSSRSLSSRSSTTSRRSRSRSPLKNKTNGDLYFADLSHTARRKRNNNDKSNHKSIVSSFDEMNNLESSNTNSHLLYPTFDFNHLNEVLQANFEEDYSPETTTDFEHKAQQTHLISLRHEDDQPINHHYSPPKHHHSPYQYDEIISQEPIATIDQNTTLPAGDYHNMTENSPNNLRNTLTKRKSLNRASVILDKNEVLEMFRTGFIARKYGRRGAPKTKLIRFDDQSLSIQWNDPDSNSNNSKEKNRFMNFLFVLSKNQSQRNNSTLDSDGVALEKGSLIYLSSIVKVYRGIQTEILSKAGLIDPNCSLSIVTKERTLDLLLSNSIERDRVVRGLQIIFDLYDFKNIILE